MNGIRSITRRRFLINNGVAASSLLILKGELLNIGFCRDGEDASMKVFDEEIENYIRPRRIPGACLVVFNKGSIVYEKGYGFADVDKKIPVTPSTLFRIASLSKPITAAGILKLVEENQLSLDSRAIGFLDGIVKDYEKKVVDERWHKITVRHLLQHTGGWDSSASGDPMFFPERKIAVGIGRQPQSPSDIIEFMLGRKLDFDPGSRYAYSNFGYCLLGRIIEKVASMSYEEFIKEKILKPVGIEKMRLGRTQFEKRVPEEAIYYTAYNNAEMKNLTVKEESNPYGSFNLERMDAHGGWIATASDYARFCIAFTEYAKTKILADSTLTTMIAPPEYVVKNGEKTPETYYGCGWLVRPRGKNGKPNLWHNGSLPGTYAFAAILGDGSGWVVLFNGRSADEKNLPNAEIDPALHRAAAKVGKLPEK